MKTLLIASVFALGMLITGCGEEPAPDPKPIDVTHKCDVVIEKIVEVSAFRCPEGLVALGIDKKKPEIEGKPVLLCADLGVVCKD